MKFAKPLLKVGKYLSPDGLIVVTRERLKHWVEQFHRMKENGLRVPVPWGHLIKAVPADPQEQAFLYSKYNAGFVDDIRLDETGDNLIADIDVPRDEDASRVGTSVREVSPWILDRFVDGRGNVWQDILSHIALVVFPVEPEQMNFEPVGEATGGVRLSLDMVSEGKDLSMEWRHEQAAQYKERLWLAFGPPDEITDRRCIWHDTAGMEWIEVCDKASKFVRASRPISVTDDQLSRIAEELPSAHVDRSLGVAVAAADRLLESAVMLGVAERLANGETAEMEGAEPPEWYVDEMSELPSNSSEMGLRHANSRGQSGKRDSGKGKAMPTKDRRMQNDGDGRMRNDTDKDRRMQDEIEEDGDEMIEDANSPDIAALIARLAEFGIEVMEAETMEAFLENLAAALEASEPNNTEELVSEPQSGVQLGLKKFAERLVRQQLLGRLKSIRDSGRAPDDAVNVLERELSGYRMSFSDTGEPDHHPIEDKIQLLEMLPEGSAWTDGERSRRLSLQSHPMPADLRGEKNDRYTETNKRLTKTY